MKIHIFGASGAGSTTLGEDLSAVLSIPHFDTDNYFWEKSDPPYTKRRTVEEMNDLLKTALTAHDSSIVTGSLVSWGPSWHKAFDLAVFLYIPHEIRMERLRQRELQRYGSIIDTDPERNRLYNEFMEWAGSYDTGTTRRSLTTHTNWISQLSCPVLTLKGDLPVIVRREMIMEHIREIISQAD